MNEENFKFCTCNFYSSELTELCVESIRSFYPKVKIIILNNGGNLELEGCEILDNTKNQLVNFDAFKYKKYLGPSSNGGSAKHTMSIDYLLTTYFNDYDNVILMDNDTYLISDFISYIKSKNYSNFLTIAEPFQKKRSVRLRFVPFIQYFNVEKIRKVNIRYFDPKRIMQIETGNESYDTGASFYEDILKNNLRYLNIKTNDFIRHLSSGSWKERDVMKFVNEGREFLKNK